MTAEPAGEPATKQAAGAAPGNRPAEPGAEVAHATRGRVRLKIPAAKRNPNLLNQIKTAFEVIPGIDAIEVRQNSGSLVIFYDPGHHPDIASLFVSLSKAEQTPVDMTPHAAAAEEAKDKARRPPKTEYDEIAGAIEAEAEYLAEHSHAARTVVEMVKELDRQVKRATGNNVDLKILVPIVLAGFTFLEIGAAAATPMWVTLAIFSMNHFVELHAHDADETGRN